MLLSLLGPVSRIDGFLTRASWFQKAMHRFFCTIWRRKGWRYAFQLCVVSILAVITEKVVNFHHIPSSLFARVCFHTLLPALVVLIGLVISAVPVGVLAFYERQLGIRDTQLQHILGALLDRCRDSNLVSTYSSSEVVQNLIAAIDTSKGPTYLVSPNGIYFQADRIAKRFNEIDKPELRAMMEDLANSAPKFRQALYDTKGTLHWIIPDVDDDRVRVYLEERADSIGISSKLVGGVHASAAQWVRKGLTTKRDERGWKTCTHPIKCVPGYRVLVAGGHCFFQVFPKDSPGLLQTVYSFEEEDLPNRFLALTALLRAWCGNFETWPT